MRDLGYVEGQNFIFDYIDLQGQADRYGAAFQQLVERKADILVASGAEEALKAALAATKSLRDRLCPISVPGHSVPQNCFAGTQHGRSNLSSGRTGTTPQRSEEPSPNSCTAANSPFIR